MALSAQYQDVTRQLQDQLQDQLKSFPRFTWRSVLRAPFTPRTFLDSVYNLLAFPLGLMWFVIFLPALVLGVGLIVLALLGLVVLFVAFVVAQGAAAIERELANAMLGSSVRAPERRDPGSWNPLKHFWARLIDPVTWKEHIYLFLRFPLGIASFATALALWAAALVGVISPFVWVLTTQNEADDSEFMWMEGPDPSAMAAGANVATGVVALFLLPWVMRAFALLYVAMAQVLLGRSRERELEDEVERLADSRYRSVDATTTERVRIERDLHDGAQARLLSLAVDLGRAKDRLSADAPDSEAAALVTEAHEQAKVALTELRDLARGIHPAVLTDRGLDAALSSLAAGSPVPVTLAIALPERPSPRIEAVSYFVLSELLANVAHHSQASQAQISVAPQDDRLILEVTDDGVGGADPAKGTGLAGLIDRAQSVDGTISVSSPSGGPTTIRADLPFV